MKILIIGAGPGGYETALLAAGRGIEVILVEASQVGGTCLNEGCIPTKSFCRNAQILDQLKDAGAFGITDLNYGFDFNAVIQRKNAVVDQLRSGVEGLLAHKNITLVQGKASFKDAHTVLVTRESSSVEYTADYIIIATGSVSAVLPVPGADLPGILTSREILDLQEVPGRLCVIGGGVIGLEFASVFRSFGSDVTVLEYCKEVLPHFDADLAKRLRSSLGKRGIEISTQSQVTAIAKNEEGYTISYMRKGKEESIDADKVLMAVGRKPNVFSLNLDDAGIGYGPRGIAVNENMQTNVPHIYAVGDINGRMMLAHAAVFQGIVALDHIMGMQNHVDLSVMPAAVFTSPEAAGVGMTEDECKEKGMKVRCLKSFFRANGKAVTMGETEGFCKFVVAEDGRVLGCHMFGPHSSDIIQEACAMISRHATVDEFASVIHVHPSLSEVLQSAIHSI